MARKDGKPGRLAQIRQTYQMTKQSDPRIGWILLGWFLLPVAVAVVASLLLKNWWLLPLGITTGLLIASIILGRRAERAAYSQIEGQPGAAAAVLNTLGKGWFITPAVAVTKNQDIVHRVIGRPGVILVGEGVGTRVTNALRNEQKREARFVPDVEFHEIVMGREEGQVPIGSLVKTVRKLPKTLTPGQVTEVRRRLDALSNQPLPMPKGPVPKSTRAMRPPRR
jgi:4-amino-4-deoxy-L-arabinose transferase-like glycosyltransferase